VRRCEAEENAVRCRVQDRAEHMLLQLAVAPRVELLRSGASSCSELLSGSLLLAAMLLQLCHQVLRVP
jgi:hypothetical protein